MTADDFAFLAREATPRVARAACVPPENGGPVRLYILPRVDPPDRKLSYEELVPTDDLYAEVGEYLDERRLIGTTVELAPMKLRGMSVVVNLQAVPRTRRRADRGGGRLRAVHLPEPVRGRLARGTGGRKWDLGRALNQGELYGIVHAVPGVDYVKILRVYETDMETGKQEAKPAGTYPARVGRDDRFRHAHHQGRASGVRMAGNGAYRTYGGGARKLGTVSLRMRRASKNEHAPSVASQREYLRQALPAVYQDNDFGVRFVGALEPLLDPVVALLDSLPAHLDPGSLRRTCLVCLRTGSASRSTRPGRSSASASSLGAATSSRAGTDPRGARADAQDRVSRASAPRRGQRGVTWEGKGETKKADKSGAGFVVYCDAPLDEHELGAVSRLIEQVKPVNVTYKLRVKAARSTGGGPRWHAPA